MKKFLGRLFIFSSFPAGVMILITMTYFYYDPFKVLYSYDNYSNLDVIYNRDYVSTEMFLKNRTKYNYNSFIFGSSRTFAFKPDSWRNYLKKDDRPFMFDASVESIYGIYRKLLLIEKLNVKIDNALIILCRDASFDNSENQEGHLYIKHPAISGESAFIFQMQFYKAYLNARFLISYYWLKLTNNYDPGMSMYIENRKIIHDPVTNESRILDMESEILMDPEEYYSKHANLFYEREGEQIFPADRISTRHMEMLKEIKRILVKNNADYKVVISPLYEQTKFSKRDTNVLTTLFGENLYDFSGKNEFTDPVTNYYETSHYRISVGDSILKIIYK